MKSAMVLLVLTYTSAVFAQTRDEYISTYNSALDAVIVSTTAAPKQRRLHFSANLYFAHEVAIAGTPLSTLLKKVDAFHEAGLDRVDIQMSLFPFLNNNAAVIAKYDAVVTRIRAHGMKLHVNPAVSLVYHPMTDLAQYKTAALQVFPQIAARYKPDTFIILHEPTTQAGRMTGGATYTPDEYKDFVKTVGEAVKAASPKTRCGAGGLWFEAAHIDAFISLAVIEVITVDIYDLNHFPQIDAIISKSRQAGKATYIEETWRPPFADASSTSLDDYMSMSIGHDVFQPLDAKWMEALSAYAASREIEAITFFWSQTFFKYVPVTEEGNALKPAYNLKVMAAIEAGERTPTFDALKKIINERSIKTAPQLIKTISVLREGGGRVDWSHHGNNKIVFDSQSADGYSDVSVMNPDGTEVVNLTHGKPGVSQRHNGNPVWHPSEKYIVFQSQNPESPANIDRLASPGAGYLNELWVMTADGNNFWKLTDLSARAGFGVLHPHFNKDGTRLCWSERQASGGAFGHWTINVADFVVSNDSPRLQNVRSYYPYDTPSFTETHGFTPNENGVIFTSDVHGNLEIYTIDLSTEAVTRVTQSGDWDEHAHYSPDGQQILWMSSGGLPPISSTNVQPRAEFWTMKPDGSAPTQLTYFNTPDHAHSLGSEAYTAADSSWSPDGRRLIGYVITSNPSGGGFDQGKMVMIEFTHVNQPPLITSSISATPTPAKVGQPITFTAAAADADGDALQYTWNFSDGTSLTGESATHAFSAAGSYEVMLAVSDADVTVTATITIEVVAPAVTKFDSDEDGVADWIELDIGTNPQRADSSPVGGVAQNVTMENSQTKLAIKLNFARESSDSLKLSAILPSATQLSGDAIIDVGGIVRRYTINEKGRSSPAGLRLNMPRNKLPKLSLSLTRTELAALFGDQGLLNQTLKSTVEIPLAIIYGGTVSQTRLTLRYSAIKDRSGSAK
jgi:Tol biopolymer transport system component